MNPRTPTKLGNGTVLQAGIANYRAPERPLSANGLILKGVVTATYVVDDDSHFQNDGRTANGAVGVYCDVLCYANIPGMRYRFVPRCLVMQRRGGIHDGDVWKPRATKLDITGAQLNLDELNPANADGDHVIVGFMSNNLNEPIILGGVNHPSVDTGSNSNDERTKLQLRQVDGDPNFLKHHGSIFGVATNGDFRVDTRFANDGDYESDGREKDPPTDGSGSQEHLLPLDASFDVAVHDMAVQPSEAKATVTFTKEKFEINFVDSSTKIVVEPDKIVLDVKGANPIQITDGQIQLGGDGDKAVTLSGILDELDKRRADHNALADAVAKHRHPSEMFWMPLIPNFARPITQHIKSAVEFTTKTNITDQGNAVVEGNAPIDEDAGTGEYVLPVPPDPDNPTRTAGLFPGATPNGDPSSTLVTVES